MIINLKGRNEVMFTWWHKELTKQYKKKVSSKPERIVAQNNAVKSDEKGSERSLRCGSRCIR